MATVPAVSGRTRYAGGIIAAVGFVLTRFIVLESVRQQASLTEFLVGPGPFLAVGLGVTVFGVALAVSTYSHRDVAIVAGWCVLGTVGAGFVVGSALVESRLGAGPMLSPTGERLLPRVLIAGAAGGVALGLRSAATGRQSRQLTAQADRLTLLNRILRHEVLNRVNIIEGYATLDSERVKQSRLDTIDGAARSIEEAIEEVSSLTNTSGAGPENDRIDLVATVKREIETARRTYPNASIDVEMPAAATVRAVADIDLAVAHLLENAIVHNEAERPQVAVSVVVEHDTVTMYVEDDGPGLPDEQRAMLASGTLPEFDDPRAGFGLTIARMLVEESSGTLRTTGDGSESGTELAMALPRANGRDSTGAYGVEPSELLDVTVAALVAGGVMGLLIQTLTGNIAIIGTLYGISSAGVGWVTHQFHSVVFGIVFAAALSGRRLRRYRDSLFGTAALGTGYGVVLWFVAAGFVMPVWLTLVGVPAPIPSLDPTSLLGHVVWGALLGTGYTVLARRRTEE